MFALRLILELAILAVCSLSPGLILLRLFRCGALEKLCLAIGTSWLAIYLAATGIYLSGLPTQWYIAISSACGLLLILSRGEIKKIFENREARTAITAFGILWGFAILALMIIRHSSEGDFYGDWFEHFQRSIFFLEHWPADSMFLEVYPLPARPPMFNLLGAFILAHTGTQYEFFQLAGLFWNLLVFFPCLLIGVAMGGRQRRAWTLLVFFAACPMFIFNATVTWTKLFAAFYVVLGTWLYYRGWLKQDSKRIVAAFAMLATGFLVHYSAGPYCVFFAAHYAIAFWKRRNRSAEVIGSALVAGGILASWFAWSLLRYGRRLTFSSNTTVTDASTQTAAGNAWRIARNIWFTIAPHPLHVPHADFLILFWQPNAVGVVRDYFAQIYDTTLVAGMGMFGGILVCYLLVRGLMRETRPARRWFWVSYLLICGVVGIAACGTVYEFGAAHICLQPIVLLGVTLLASQFGRMPGWMKAIAVIGLTIDFCLGVFLQIHIEGIYIEPKVLLDLGIFPISARLLSQAAIANMRIRAGFKVNFLGDRFVTAHGFLEMAIVLIFAALLYRLVSRWSRKVYAVALVLLMAGAVAGGLDEIRSSGKPILGDQIATEPAAGIRQLQSELAPYFANVAQYPDSPLAQRELGEAVYEHGQLMMTMDSCSEAYMLDPSDLLAQYEVYLAYGIRQDIPAGVPERLAAAQAVFQHPQSADAQVSLGKLLLSRGHVNAAIARFSEALRLNPDDLEAKKELEMAHSRPRGAGS